MFVQVRLFATLREGRFKEKQMELPNGSKVRDLLDHLQIGEEQAHIVLVNGTAATGERRPASNDVISIFPPMAGG